MAILAGDAAMAERVLAALDDAGTRGRAVDADRQAIRAGLAALAGDREAAISGYRAAQAAYHDLGLAWDEALMGMDAAWTLGTADPAVAGWVEAARLTFARLEAAPMLDRLAEAIGHGDDGKDGDPAPAAAPVAGAASVPAAER